MVKSPDPVNWTVPLDTGKTFTVTQNIPEGMSHFIYAVFYAYIRQFICIHLTGYHIVRGFS